MRETRTTDRDQDHVAAGRFGVQNYISTKIRTEVSSSLRNVRGLWVGKSSGIRVRPQ